MSLTWSLKLGFLTALLAAVCTAIESELPRFVYNPQNGRVTVETLRDPTPSVFWDRVTQSVVADERPGPTIGSFAAAVVHSAIFDAWYHVEVALLDKDDSDECGHRKIATSYAASTGLRMLFPAQAVRINRELNVSLQTCPHVPTDDAAVVGIGAAQNAFNLRSTKVLPSSNSPTFPWRSPIEQWKPERVPIDDPSGVLQSYLAEDWGQRYTFGVSHGASVFVKKPESFLSEPGKLDFAKKTIFLDSGENITAEISELDEGDNTTKTGTNPRFVEVVNSGFVEQALRVVKSSAELTAQQKFTAELWEQGGGTSYPPGSWLTIGQFVSARKEHSAENDVKMFFALANALSDAAVTTWYVKRYYNYTRPVRAIRDLGELGLLGNISFYDVTKSKMVHDSATRFVTYQLPDSDPSPPFPEYTSGHSGFSAAAAEVLKRFTGSDELGISVELQAKSSRFEPGVFPVENVTLKFKTFSDAAEDAGISRIYGGIHFDDGNSRGLELGRVVGAAAFRRAKAKWKEYDSFSSKFFSRRHNL